MSAATRPVRIDQIIPSIVEHDAVSNHTFAAQALLREMGFASDIYALVLGPGVQDRVVPLAKLDATSDRDWVLYQHSIGSPAAEVFRRHPGRKLLDYHNVTPAHLVERFLPTLADESRLGRAQLADLSGVVGFALADSPFNASELVANGYDPVRVVPVLIEPANLAARPDAATGERLGLDKGAGGSDWLFVGQIAPHKAQHDLIRALVCFRRLFDGQARLHIVGREMGATYLDALKRFSRRLGLGDAVHFTGSVPAPVLAAYYEQADVFVCLSDHEGFCAPLVEAMARGLPVVAYRAGAVPDTVGDAGLLLSEKDPLSVAAAVQAVITSDGRAALGEPAKSQVASLSLDRAQAAFRQAIEEALAVL